MKIKTGLLKLIFLLLIASSMSSNLYAYRNMQDDSTAVQIERVKELITYLEFALNTIGDAYTPRREKDIIITTSYSKFFRDEDVQVEDDLDLGRSTVTNKDVQAYLKDVEFFFKNVSFTLDIEDIQPMINDSSQLFYLVKMNRNLNGITVLGDTINETITRYIEVNYYENTDDLKIVSFYTTKLSEKEDLMNWWEELSFEWKYIFQQKFNYYDSVGYEELKVLIEIDSLDLSSNRYIYDFEPLFKLNQLKYLNLSNTSIEDLTPLRVHNKIMHLDISDTEIDTIEHIRYASEIRYLNLSDLQIKDISILENYPKLEHLVMNNCEIDSISFEEDFQNLNKLELSHFNSDSYDWISRFPELHYLDASYSNITNMGSLSNNENLKILILEGTEITDINPIRSLPVLEELNLESTNIGTLADLSGTTSLKKIYCDNSSITNQDANDFMNLNPSTLVLFESEELQAWWNDLDNALQSLFSTKFSLSMQPSIEELAEITKEDSLYLEGLKTTDKLPELWPFRNLVFLDMHDTYISDISSITQTPNLAHIDAASSNISNIDSLKELKQLDYLDLRGTRVSSIESLTGLRGLRYLDVDDAQVETSDILKFIDSNPECLVIYRSIYLVNWWEGLSDEWKEILSKNAGIDQYQIDNRNLHIITYLENIKIDSINVKDLNPLDELYYLKGLEINRVNINDISKVQGHKGLTLLKITASPVSDFSSITSLKQLKHLDISNTGITDLDFISELKALEILKISGTRIKKLNPLSSLTHLKELDISNTGIKSLKPIGSLMGLEMITCYNTGLKSKAIDGFKADHPDRQVLYY
jgi:Leucine-rich repeat (LRR) protein